MTEAITVNLGERAYSILLGADLTGEVRAKAAELAAAGRKAVVVTDANVAKEQGSALRAMFGDTPTWVAPPGEETKSLGELGRILEFFAASRLDRSAAVFAFGGGVIGDLGGFAAASFLRGIDYYQVPTTLLAMVDSSVGGKTGVNLAAGKNMAGAFHQPRGVFVATGMLATLPRREFAAGAAEVIKVGLLGEPALFAQLESAPLTATGAQLPAVIRRCCAIKAEIVEADERELALDGGRALLNLGHTFAHSIEQASGYGVYLHGEAVAIGLSAAARLSQKLGLISAKEVARVESVVSAHGLPARLRSPLKVGALLAAMARDKKARAGGLRFVVMEKLGKAVTRDGVDPALAEACLREVGAD